MIWFKNIQYISKHYNERKMTERTEAFEYENVMNLRHMLLHKQQCREIPS